MPKQLLLVFALLLHTLPLFGQDRSIGEIRDRNGVVLARLIYSEDKIQREYPFDSLAIHLLDGLTVLPGPGETLQLTIDGRIQAIVEEEMKPVGLGAAVVVDPASGAILASASVPSYSPGEVFDDNSPLVPHLNRAVTARAPGATFLPLTAMAAAMAGKENEIFPCDGGFQIGARLMKCHTFGSGNFHGELSLAQGLEKSCGPYFFQLGIQTGLDQLDRCARMLGFGVKSGVPLKQDSEGIYPSRQWLAEKYPNERSSDGYTANTSIGQGFTLATPLQLAMLSATLANGGYSYKPSLIYRTKDGVRVLPALRENLLQHGLTPEAIAVIREGLMGRSKLIKLPPSICGYTGTAQAWKADGQPCNHNWSVAYAPVERPAIAVCTLVQNAKGGYATDVSTAIIGRIQSGKLPAPTPVQPNRGHDKQMLRK